MRIYGKNILKIRHIYFIVNSQMKVISNEIIITHGIYLFCHVLQKNNCYDCL